MLTKKINSIILAAMIILSLTACSKNQEVPPNPASDQAEQKLTELINQNRLSLLTLYDNPSVSQARIENNRADRSCDNESFNIDLDKATASIEDSERTVLVYALDESQVEQLERLLSEYALTVFDDKPYWPAGDYCTMIQLFEFSITFKDGYYREYGATHYPIGWDEFIRDLRGIIMTEKEREI